MPMDWNPPATSLNGVWETVARWGVPSQGQGVK